MAKQEFNPAMVETLKRNGSKSVYINDKGEWLFHPTAGYSEYSRSEVIGGKQESNSNDGKVKEYKKMNVEELTAVCIEKEIPAEEYEGKKKGELVALLEAKDLASA